MEVTPRRYDDPCGIARALNCVGERWSLLVVRELLFGPKRFSDLRRGLPSISPNVLTQRLHDLEAAGVLARRHLGPPTSGMVYELTDPGTTLRKVLEALALFGKRLPIESEQALSTNALLLAMQTSLRDAHRDIPSVAVRLHERGDLLATVTDGQLQWTQDRFGRSAATIELATLTLAELVFGGLTTSAAEANGRLEISGDRRVARSFLAAFDP